jgi:hypothetical protein
MYVPGPVGYVQATSIRLTFDLLICFSDEYCEESEPPRYWFQVAKDRSAAEIGGPDADTKIASRKLGAELRVMAYPPTGKSTTRRVDVD